MSTTSYRNLPLPKGLPHAFLFRRLHSIAGAFFVLFLCEHILTNSSSALLIGEEGSVFIRGVNFLQSLPYLPVLEIVLLAVPIAIHAFLGIRYFMEARWNSFASDGSTPSLGYLRNHAFTWQRITALILIVGVFAHVVTMRFLQRPDEIMTPTQKKYAVPVIEDPGLITLAPRLRTMVITPRSKVALLEVLDRRMKVAELKLQMATEPTLFAANDLIRERLKEYYQFISALSPTETSWTVLAPDFGTALLLIVRENFRTPWICALYTIFIFAAAFHASNGLWTWAISWGIPLNECGRRVVRGIGVLLCLGFLFGGLASIWLTYFVTLNS